MLKPDNICNCSFQGRERGTDRKKKFCNKNDEKFPNSVGSTQEERN